MPYDCRLYANPSSQRSSPSFELCRREATMIAMAAMEAVGMPTAALTAAPPESESVECFLDA